MKKILSFGLLCCLTACTQPKPAPTTDAASTDSSTPHDTQAATDALPADDATESQPITTPDGKIQIDWSLIDTKTPRAELMNYPYPIAIDSQAVKNYATAYNISDSQAQHSIVVSMAAPEALGKLLDQLEDSYLSHELTDGADMTLIIHTKGDVVADQRDYVFADKFGEGLVLPIKIIPKQ